MNTYRDYKNKVSFILIALVLTCVLASQFLFPAAPDSAKVLEEKGKNGFETIEQTNQTPASENLPLSIRIMNESMIGITSKETMSMERLNEFTAEVPEQFMLDVPIIMQGPELLNGCEVTSLSMLTLFLGLPYSKLDLAEMVVKDRTPMQKGESGEIEIWGDPNIGFVGDITGKMPGYAIYNKPLERLLSYVYENGETNNLSDRDFKQLQLAVSSGKPVVVWNTSFFDGTGNWVEWKTENGISIKATFNEHAVLLVGYDSDFVYINNPLNGQKAQKVDKDKFIKGWEQLGKQALTVK